MFVKSKTSRNRNVKSQSSREVRNTTVLSEFSTFLKLSNLRSKIFFYGYLFLPYLRLTVKIFNFYGYRLSFGPFYAYRFTPLRPSFLNLTNIFFFNSTRTCFFVSNFKILTLVCSHDISLVFFFRSWTYILQISTHIFYCIRCILQVPTYVLCFQHVFIIGIILSPTERLLPHAKMLLVPIKSFFLCWVDYDLEGCTFSLSNCDFSRLFHTKRSWHTYWF